MAVDATATSAESEDETTNGTAAAELESLNRLTDELNSYLSPEQVAEVRHAYRFGAAAHAGQLRKSGEPYICHPLDVSLILAQLRLDANTVIAGILHDTIEDTPTTHSLLSDEFNEEVATLVDGVTKLDKVHFQSREEQQAENFRKMLLAMSRDIRVILIKLADRTHNMRTLGSMSRPAARRIGRETLEIYAPIAARLGMNTMRKELEDLGFAALYPWRHAALGNRMNRRIGKRRDVIRKMQISIHAGMVEQNIEGRVLAREKHLYSLYKKMRSKQLDFTEVMDVYAARVLVKNVDDCYRMLGVVHNVYRPVPDRFKDYIAIPKSNGYQSLHTVLHGPDGVPFELQIRTEEMDQVAENGIAAHWLYKSDPATAAAPEARSLEWLRSLLEIQQRAGNSAEFLESVKVDLFPDEVYVFTPQGDILRLPTGATVIDFAYAVHSDVGNATIGARINRRMAPLSAELQNGQTVEIITSASAQPNPVWLNFATTAKARTTIRAQLRSLQSDDASKLGRRLLDKALDKLGSRLTDIDDDAIDQLVDELDLPNRDSLWVDIGLGERPAPLLAHRLMQQQASNIDPDAPMQPLSIQGGEGLAITLAKCCHPIPGDSILGYVSAGRGLVVHRRGCRNLADYKKHPERWVEVEWATEQDREYPVEVRLDTLNKRGALAGIASLISSEDSNIEHIEIIERDGSSSTMQLLFTVRSRNHLAQVLRRLKKSDAVLHVNRTNG